ncbi:hypothetical protein IFHNHDMJ_01962 [Synechococcus sp. CBW1107]|nr:hypothetical protein IFHNHDMJ_01962 [Synechococcus sp. CBW1107]
MGVWPPDVCLQGLASNHPMLLRSKAVVVSDGEKAELIRQVSDEKVSASEPSMTHRNAFQLLSKRAEACTARISVGDTCLRTTWQPVYRRHELITGLDTERGNLTWDAKGKDQVATIMSLNTNDLVRGGAVRSSDEEAVIALERRNCVIQSDKSDQPGCLGGIR